MQADGHKYRCVRLLVLAVPGLTAHSSWQPNCPIAKMSRSQSLARLFLARSPSALLAAQSQGSQAAWTQALAFRGGLGRQEDNEKESSSKSTLPFALSSRNAFRSFASQAQDAGLKIPAKLVTTAAMLEVRIMRLGNCFWHPHCAQCLSLTAASAFPRWVGRAPAVSAVRCCASSL